MPASQLKRLKQSLRDQGITGPQKSKKRQKQLSQQKDKRNDRAAALQNIRDSFNPFELKATNARPEKFQSATQNGTKGAYKAALHRPGVTKSAGEQMRRSTLLPEMRRRSKVGGLVDRRIGEGDAEMTPEEKAVQRFAREKERAAKGRSLFDLEGSDDEAGGGFKLTHGGKGLDGLVGDDFRESMSGGSDDDSDDGFMRKKRRRSDFVEIEGEEVEDAGEGQPERKKTKKEVMEEIIAKSKMHKYERQKAKEDDDDLREELDKGWGDIEALLQGVRKPPPPPKQSEPAATAGNGPTINPDRQRLLDGIDRDKADKEYDVYLKKLANEARAKPSNKSLTAEEKAEKEAKRLKDLEDKRLKRMQGEDVSEDEAEAKNDDIQAEGDEDNLDEAADFGFTSTMQPKKQKLEQLVLDDEDEFALEDDLVASEDEIEDVELSNEEESGSEDEGEVDGEQKPPADEEDEFVKDILGADIVNSASGANDTPLSTGPRISYTFPCPRSHAELLDVIKNVPVEQLATVVQRIRALYHPSLSASNKESMADFSSALVDHLSWMADHDQPVAIIEQIIRHLHSLSRTYPNQIGEAFRRHIAAFSERGQPTSGDLVQLTAIDSIYPTSDHWHQVVTPAITTMAKWLALNSPSSSKSPSAKTLSIGAFLVALCLRYQRLSKRYIPEAIRFTQRALASKVEVGLLSAHVTNLAAMADLWKDKTAFIEIFKPSLPLLKRLNQKGAHTHISVLTQQARQRRQPLALHHHKKLPIRTSIPKFVEDFNPDKHYDPDKERSDANKLQKEYKRERKGALRELRKDANFIAREQLKEKRERDAEYEKKYRESVLRRSSTYKRSYRWLKETCVHFHVRKDHYDAFKTLAIHHLRTSTTVISRKEQVNDVPLGPSVKLVVSFLTTYGSALWPANFKVRTHLLKADLGTWGKKFGLETPTYVKDASMNREARAKYRKENGDRDPRGDVEMANSKLEKLMSEYFDALLHTMDDEGGEGRLDGDDILNAILGRCKGDEYGSNGIHYIGVANASHASVSRESSNSGSRESSPDTPLVVEHVHRSFAHTSINNLTSGEDTFALSASFQQNSTTAPASRPSSEQEISGTEILVTLQEPISQPGIEAIPPADEESASVFNSLMHDSPNFDASPGADAEATANANCIWRDRYSYHLHKITQVDTKYVYFIMTYTVQSGDTLWSISQKLGVSLQALEAANPGVTPDKLQKHDISLEALEAANPGVNASSLQVGQVLNLPPGSTPGTTNSGQPNNSIYVNYDGPASNFPDAKLWANYDTLWAQNRRLMAYHDSPTETALIKSSIDRVSSESGVDRRVILCIIVQESGGNARVRTTFNGVLNPGLMQSHNGVGLNPADPAGSILQMIRDGTEGTKDGDGLKQCYAKYGNWYSAFRAYNSGSVNQNDLNDPVGATAHYVRDAANRLMGHTWSGM
ncbi:hypothetical protein AC579_4781 [Pseudocercospora musae]|uniref:LysM domain-containing protein n=1 Tax=Pseudocercospora musae TaxID=113226 RepID=A0A139I801_9PEZI|nr:hypothetical protein AC579_4781 [Pseudocercospora musae]